MLHFTRFDGKRLWGVLLATLVLMMTAACQTTAGARGAFSKEQIEMLRHYEFQEVEDNWELGLQGKLLFPFDTSDLVAEQHQRIDQMARELGRVGISGARVEGHTDSVGTAQYNQALSLRRAEAVRQALLSGGMRDQNVAAMGRGSSQPIADNADPEGRKENRRVVVIISPENAASY